MSLSRARLQPSPTAGPFTAAITGTGQRTMPVMMRRASAMFCSRNVSSRCTRVIT